jgi:hypothetical protein
MKSTVSFGPFCNVESNRITFAGWPCSRCRKPVRKMAVAAPNVAPRMIFYACPCVTVCCWQDERQPNAKIWPSNVGLALSTGSKVVVFNGDKPTPPDFQGIN